MVTDGVALEVSPSSFVVQFKQHWDSRLDPVNDHYGRGNHPVHSVQFMGWRFHRDKYKSLAEAGHLFWMHQRCSQSVTNNALITLWLPQVPLQCWLYSNKTQNSDSPAFQSRHFWLTWATLNLKHCAMWGAVLPSLQVVQHWIFK